MHTTEHPHTNSRHLLRITRAIADDVDISWLACHRRLFARSADCTCKENLTIILYYFPSIGLAVVGVGSIFRPAL